MSLRGTASGRLFAAYLPRELVLAALAAERADGPHAAGRAPAPCAAIDAAFRRQLEQVRRHGLSHTVDGAVPGVSALAAPVFDESGHIVLSLTAIGPSAIFDTSYTGPLAAALRRSAEELSRQLGAPAAA